MLLGNRVAHSLKYRPEIDGLRGIAVLAVFCYHADLHWCKGGFVGVDIFFVMSGFLITTIIQSDLDQDRFSVRRFYERRVRRIFPALVFMALCCAAAAAILLPPVVYLDFGKSLLAMTGFVSNLYFHSLGTGAGYFDPAPEPQPLLHTWSIAIEEQFYVLFPALLLWMHRKAKRGLDALLVFLLMVSFGLSVWGSLHQPMDAFYLLPSRAWEFLAGALLTRPYLQGTKIRAVREIAAAGGLLALAYGIVTYSGTTVFPGVAALAPVLGTAALLYAGSGGTGSGGADSIAIRLLKFPPLVFVGVISYSLYLWHWPVLVFGQYVSGRLLLEMLSRDQMAELFVLAFAGAIVSYRFIELPFRTKGTRAGPRQILWLGLGSTATLTAVSLTLILGKGLPGRFSPRKQAMIAANEAVKEIPRAEMLCDNYERNPTKFSDVIFCQYGHAAHNILLWGDSHVNMLLPMAQQMQAEGDFKDEGVITATMGSCPLTEQLNRSPFEKHCDLFSSFAMRRALQPDIDTVYVGLNPWWLWDRSLCVTRDGQCVSMVPHGQESQRFMDAFARQLALLEQHGKHVVLSLQFPIYGQSVPDVEIRNIMVARFTGPREPLVLPLILQQQLGALAAADRLTVFDPGKDLCRDGRCLYEVGGVSLYRDGSHLSLKGLEMVRASLRQALMSPPANDQAGGNPPR